MTSDGHTNSVFPASARSDQLSRTSNADPIPSHHASILGNQRDGSPTGHDPQQTIRRVRFSSCAGVLLQTIGGHCPRLCLGESCRPGSADAVSTHRHLGNTRRRIREHHLFQSTRFGAYRSTDFLTLPRQQGVDPILELRS